jgi:NADH-quinone oxidoreductase subunit L
VFFLNRGYFDEVYEAMIIRPYSQFAAWLWRGIEVFLFDRPANGLATALFKMSARLSKVVDVKKTTKSELLRIMLVILVMLLILLLVVETLLSVILH